jgi:hypothetical protein
MKIRNQLIFQNLVTWKRVKPHECVLLPKNQNFLAKNACIGSLKHWTQPHLDTQTTVLHKTLIVNSRNWQFNLAPKLMGFYFSKYSLDPKSKSCSPY